MSDGDRRPIRDPRGAHDRAPGLGTRAGDIRTGDLLEVARDDGRRERRRVKYPPWPLGDGTWVVGLEGLRGGYALSRCRYPGGEAAP